MSKSNKISFSLNAGGGHGGGGHGGHGGHGGGYRGRGGYGRYPYGYYPLGYPYYGYPLVVYDEEGVDAVEGATDFKHDVGNTTTAGGLNLSDLQKNMTPPKIVIKNPVKTETEMMAAKKEIEIAAEKGALNQEQANSIAQQIYITQQMEMRAKFTQGYVSPTGKWLEQLKGSGFEYKKVPATIIPAGMIPKAAGKPEHGEAVRIVSVVAETKAPEEAPKVEEAKVSGGNTALYVVCGIVVVAAIAYFGYPYLAKMAEKKHH